MPGAIGVAVALRARFYMMSVVARQRAIGTQIAELAASHATHRDAPTDYEQAVLAFLARILPDDAGVIGAR